MKKISPEKYVEGVNNCIGLFVGVVIEIVVGVVINDNER